MATPSPTKMKITVEIATGKILNVEDENGTDVTKTNRPIPNPPHEVIGVLFKHQGSNCITLNMPGGGSYQICG